MLVFVDLVETPDYFEDSEKFYKKLSDLKGEMDDIIEIYEDIIIHNIIDDLKDFEKKYDDEEEEKNDEEVKQMASDGMNDPDGEITTEKEK